MYKRYFISLRSFYEYDNTIFDNILLPDGIDKQTVVNTIMDYCGENEPLYNSLTAIRTAIELFFAANFTDFKKMHATTVLEYDPLINYDLTEELEETSESNDRSTSTSNTSVNAYDVDYAVPDSSAGSVGENEGDSLHKLKRRTYGDASVRSTQDIIKQEREVSDFSIYTYIANKFEDVITITVY